MKAGRVILMHGRSLQALIAAKSLCQRGVEVIGCDETPLMALSFSRFVKETFLHAPLQEGEEQVVQDLVKKIAHYRLDGGRPLVVMPINRLTYAVSRYRHRLAPHALVAAPETDLITRVQPKHHLLESAWAHHIPVPKTWVASDRESLEQAKREAGFPCLMKLTDGTGGIGIEQVDTPSELERTFRGFQEKYSAGKDRPVLVQEFVPGDDYCVTALCEHGEMKANMVYRNLRKYPRDHGFGILRETVAADELVELSRGLLAGLHWHGVAEVDFRWDPQVAGSGKLIEVNPRFWGGLFQSVASGIDYPWLLYQLTTEGHVSPSPPPQIGTKTRVPLLGLLSQLERTNGEDESHWQRLVGALESGWQELLGGQTKQALHTWSSGLLASVDPRDRLREIHKWLVENDGAEAEMLSKDDPLAVLGVLYVLGSLVRTGTLPQELRRSGDW